MQVLQAFVGSFSDYDSRNPAFDFLPDMSRGQLIGEGDTKVRIVGYRL